MGFFSSRQPGCPVVPGSSQDFSCLGLCVVAVWPEASVGPGDMGLLSGVSRAVGCEGRPSPNQSLHWLDSPNTSTAPMAQNILFLLRFISGQQQIIHHCKSVQGNEAISLFLAQSGLHEQISQPHRVLPRCMGTGIPSSRSFLPRGHRQVLCALGLGS